MALTKVSTPGIKDEAITLAKLLHGDSSSNGKFLRANNGADPSFETITIPASINNLEEDTTPELGGDLETNGSNILIEGDDKIDLASYAEIKRKTAATNAVSGGLTGYVQQNSLVIDGKSDDIWLSNSGNKIIIASSDSLTHEVARFQLAAVGASQHGFVTLNYVTANAGGSASMAQRLLTTQTGMTLTGVIVPAADSTHDLGTNAVRWRNIYADTLYGDGSNLTGISAGVSVSNNANNRLITGDGTNLVAESAFVFDGTKLGLGTHTGIPNTKVDIGLGVHAADGDDDASDWGANNVFQLTATGGNAANNEVLLVGCHSGGVGQIGSAIGFGRESTTNWGTYLSFKTHPTDTSNIDRLKERVRLKANGEVLINAPSTYSASSSADNLIVYDANAAGITIATSTTNQDCSIFFADADDNDNGRLVYMTGNRQFRFYLDGNGNPVMQWNPDFSIYFNGNMYSNGGQYSTGSDLNMKSNLVRFTDTLNKLKEIVGYKFDITVPSTGAKISSAGVIAQDVEKVYPELVEEVEGYKHLQYNALIGVLVEAVKELTTRVETLEAA